MLSEGTMAGLAVNTCMLSGFFHVCYVGMAGFAGWLAGKVYWVGCDLCDRCSAIVTVFPEALWHNKVAHHEEYDERNRKQKRKSE
jgi:hypothetical protein